MNDDIDKLKRDYQAVTAPLHLATRIKAGVNESRARGRRWIPITTACSAVVALVLLVPKGDDSVAPPATIALQPSLSSLAALKPSRPATPAPSLSQIRSMRVPSLPEKPVTAPVKEITYEIEHRVLKEKNDAHT